MGASGFGSREAVARGYVDTPYGIQRRGGSSKHFALCFVGDELWAQTGGCVWRIGPKGRLRPLRVTDGLQLVRTQGRYVELRARHGWSRSFVYDSPDGIHLYDRVADRWFQGPWPEELPCWFRFAIEPEDFLLVEPHRGLELDVARWDRHGPIAFGPRSQVARIDDQWVDLTSGACRPVRWPAGDQPQDWFPDRPPVVLADPDDPRPAQYCRATAGARSPAGAYWLLDVNEVDPRVAVLSRDGEPLALVRSCWRGAAFDPEVERLALVSRRHVAVYDLNDLGEPSEWIPLPWPWLDPFEAVEAAHWRPELVEQQQRYRDEYAPYLDEDRERRAQPRRSVAPTEGDQAALDMPDDGDIPF